MIESISYDISYGRRDFKIVYKHENIKKNLTRLQNNC